MDFARTVSYSLAVFKKAEARSRYPSPYYQRMPDSAIAVYGYYLPDLVAMKKEGVLRSWGYFGVPDISSLIVADVQLKEIVPEAESKRRQALLFSPHEKNNS